MSAPPREQRRELTEAIDRRLPQTQCTQCDYPGCLDYARAIAAGQADINQCPPGGDVSIHALARLLERPARPLNPEHGVHRPPRPAIIREADCIGCKLCIQACPVDCIVGAAKLMHTVITADCSGCELCLPVCPTDCITLAEPAAETATHPAGAETGPAAPGIWPEFSRAQVEKFRRRARHKRRRLAAREHDRARRRNARLQSAPGEEILAVLKRKRQSP